MNEDCLRLSLCDGNTWQKKDWSWDLWNDPQMKKSNDQKISPHKMLASVCAPWVWVPAHSHASLSHANSKKKRNKHLRKDETSFSPFHWGAWHEQSMKMHWRTLLPETVFFWHKRRWMTRNKKKQRGNDFANVEWQKITHNVGHLRVPMTTTSAAPSSIFWESLFRFSVYCHKKRMKTNK